MFEFELKISNVELSIMLDDDNLSKDKDRDHYMIQKPSKWFAFIEKQLIVLDTSFDLKKLLVIRIAEYMCATFLSNCCKGKCQCLIDHLISSNFAEKF